MAATVSAQRDVAELDTGRALAREVVHKAAPEQVFVTDWMRGPGEDWCTIAARLPLAHARFSDSAAPYHDLLLIAETVRQAGLVVVSEILDVEGDRQFLLRELKVELDPLEHARKSRDSCDVLISQDPSSEVRMRPGRAIASGLMRARVAIGGRPAGVCEVMGAWVPESFYASLRKGNVDAASGQGLPEPSPRSDVEVRTGKVSPANSVLTPLRATAVPRGYEASLVIETDDPTFFDHPLDHVPGLYLLEGLQQVSVAAACEELGVDHARVVVSGFEIKFARIAEFQPDVVCAVELDQGCGGGQVSCSQGGKACCEGTVRLVHV
jgi:2-oxo-3-(phosphooxy)propyl 3-oxoalkanoate synthase